MIELPPYPRRASNAAVRDADPLAYRLAASGVGTLALGVLLLVGWALVQFEVVRAAWLDTLAGLVAVVLLWAGVLGLALGAALVAYPAGVRRELALHRFARSVGLSYARFGAPLEMGGVFFAERAPGADPSYGSAFELYRPPFDDAPLRLGVATFEGGRDAARGPRHAFRFLALRLPRPMPHIMIDSLRNGRLRAELPGAQRVSLEGEMDRHFAVYAPLGYARDALQVLTPDVLVCLLEHGRNWDVEVVDDLLLVASTRFRRGRDATEVPALLRFATLLGAEIRTQVVPYTDPRAVFPRTQVAAAGRRLRRRSVWCDIAILLGLVIGVPAAILGGVLLVAR